MVSEKNPIKDLVRLLLVFMIVYYLPVSMNMAAPVYRAAAVPPAELPAEENAGGIGGEIVAAENVSVPAGEALPVDPSLELEDPARPRMLLWTSYTVKQGDVIGKIATDFGLETGTLMSVNDIKNARGVQLGKTLKIPNQDGVMYKIAKGDTLDAIAEKHKIETRPVIVANELFSDKINANSGGLFLAGAKFVWEDERVKKAALEGAVEQTFNGTLFLWPVSGGRITSYYGWRRNPITRRRGLHAGLDIAAPTGTPIKAALDGTVSAVGWSDIYGNFVVIIHADGYRSLYGHMDVTHTQPGAIVQTGDIIGEVGNTGQSTGPHLHFETYKDGAAFNPIRYIKR